MLQNLACDYTPSSQKTFLVECDKLIPGFFESQILIPRFHPNEPYSASVKYRNDLYDFIARHVGYSLIGTVKVKQTIYTDDSSLEFEIRTF